MRFIIYGFLICGSIYLANLFYGPIIKNHMLEGKMINLANEPRLKDDPYIMRDLLGFIDENKMSVEERAITIDHPQPKMVEISAHYEVHCKFWFLEKDYDFRPSTVNEGRHGVLPDFAAY